MTCAKCGSGRPERVPFCRECGAPPGSTTVHTKVMATFEVDAKGRIKQMRECFDMKSLTDQLKAVGFQVPG